ncbi:MAG: sugar-binding protein [Prosthecobacter sp.]|nr:sugar-binding protein [Prosthecobacter sp.]
MTSTSTASFCILRRPPFRQPVALLLFITCLLQSADTGAPPWWTTQQVLKSGAAADDYAVANLGQLKTIARKAAQEMNAVLLPEGAGTNITQMIDGWAATPGAGVTRDDYAVLTLGQLKTVAKPFYDRLADVGLGPANTYPWTGINADDYALANLGQVKTVFAFDIVDPDSNHNTIPDSWEIQMFGNLSQPASGDFDGDGLTNLAEFLAGTNPTNVDTDDDGYTDGEESTGNTNPNSIDSHPIDEIPALAQYGESLPWTPGVSIAGYYRTVFNHWDQYDGYDFQTGQPKRLENGTLQWASSWSSSGDTSYFTFEPRWQDKLGELTFPTTAMNNIYNFGPHAHAYHGLSTVNNPYHQSGWVNLVHVGIGLRLSVINTGQSLVPWELGKRYLRCKSSMAGGWDESIREIDSVEMLLLKIPGPDQGAYSETPAALRLDMSPSVVENTWREDDLYELYLSASGPDALALENITYTEDGPQHWFMVPQGGTSTPLFLGSGALDAHKYGVFKTVGGVTAAEVSGSSQFSTGTYTFNGDQEGDSAVLQAGVKPAYNSPESDAEFASTPMLHFAVYSKKTLKVNIIPITYQEPLTDAGPPLTVTTHNVPDAQVLQDFLNSVFHAQANIEISVTVSESVVANYDIGVGRPGMEKKGDKNGTLDVIWSPAGTPTATLYSAEEEAIVNASANQRRGDALNVYLVAAKPRVNAIVSPLVAWNAALPGVLINGVGYQAWAGSADNQQNVRAVWVIDFNHTLTENDFYIQEDLLLTIAHEIGHVLGLIHPNETHPDGTVWNKNSDLEDRMMTTFWGPKRWGIPKRMIKQEWDAVRTYTGFASESP